MGVIDGFSFAESGTLTVKNVPANTQSLAIPADFRNAAGLADVASWSLEVLDGDGRSRGMYCVSSVSASSIVIAKRGLMMILR